MDHLGGSLSIHFVYSNKTQLTLDFQLFIARGPRGGRLAIRIMDSRVVSVVCGHKIPCHSAAINQ